MGFDSEIQISIYNVLNGNISAPVYDDPGKKPQYPYVIIGDDSSVEFDTDNTVGRDVLAKIHVWDNYRGKKRIKDLFGEIDSLLNRANFPISGYDLIDSRFDSSDVFFDSDGKTRHGILTYRLLIDEA